MAYTNIADSALLTVGTKNDTLPNSVGVPVARGAVVTNGTTVTTATSITTGEVLTWQASGAPAFAALPGGGLPLIPSGAGPYRLVTNPITGAAAWACRKPHLMRTISNNGSFPSVFPTFSSSSNSFYAEISDEIVQTARQSVSGGVNISMAASEAYDPGFLGNVAGQKFYFSMYCKSGFPTAINNGYHGGVLGWASWADLLTQSINFGYYQAGVSGVCCFYWDNAYPTFNWNSSDNPLNTPTTGTYNNNFNGLIVSCGWSATGSPTVTNIMFTLWQHDAVTGSLVSQRDFTLGSAPTGLINSTGIVPFIMTGYNVSTSNPTLCIMSTGYPAISGYTYFYDR